MSSIDHAVIDGIKYLESTDNRACGQQFELEAPTGHFLDAFDILTREVHPDI
ncbi:hypothetical protein D3C87_1882520 [compost metagenome]